MKVTPEHLAMIRDAIEATGHDNATTRDQYRRRDIPRGAMVQDIDKRFRWDLFHAATAGTRMVSDLYDAGYHDAHIDTALRAVVPTLTPGA